MFRYRLRTLLIVLGAAPLLIGVAVPPLIAASRTDLGWFIYMVLANTLAPCVVITTLCIACLCGLLLWFHRGNMTVGRSCCWRAAKGGYITMLAFYLPAFVANTTLSANIGINRANYMDLIFLAIASVVVIPQLALLGAACFSAPRSRPAQSNTKSRSAED